MSIVGVEEGVWNNQRQFVYVLEKPLQILSSHCRHVHNVPVISKYPEIARIYSLKTVTTEWARLGTCLPEVHSIEQ